MHVILIPRVGAPPRVPANLKSLYTLLHSSEVGKKDAKKILQEMKEDAETLIKQEFFNEEMIRLVGFKEPIWMGFRVPSSHE